MAENSLATIFETKKDYHSPLECQEQVWHFWKLLKEI